MQRSRFLWVGSYAGMCALIAVAACAVAPVDLCHFMGPQR